MVSSTSCPITLTSLLATLSRSDELTPTDRDRGIRSECLGLRYLWTECVRKTVSLQSSCFSALERSSLEKQAGVDNPHNNE